MTERQPAEIARLIEQSSLGMPDALALRALTDPSVVDDILRTEPSSQAEVQGPREPPPAQGWDDAELARRFAAGDEDAVSAVYQRYARPILTTAMATLGRRDLADEAVQTTMLKAWRAAGSFDPSRELAPWLYAIARRVAIDIYRRESRAAAPSELGDDAVAEVPLSFERTWEVSEIRMALDKLPDDEREVVRLSHLAGMTHQQIADHLGVPVGTVKSRSARANRRLTALLGREDTAVGRGHENGPAPA